MSHPASQLLLLPTEAVRREQDNYVVAAEARAETVSNTGRVGGVRYMYVLNLEMQFSFFLSSMHEAIMSTGFLSAVFHMSAQGPVVAW
jgi:hypothetical protein